MKAVIYHAFSHKEAKEHDVQELGSQQDCESHLQRKAVVFEYFTRQKPKQQQKKSKGLTAKQRRDMRLFDINPEQQRYSLFLPLHELWKQYIRDLCNGLKPDTHEIQVSLLCGCHRNPSAGDKACLQDHHQRRPPESYPQAKLCVHHRNGWLYFLHLWKQIPTLFKREVCQEIQSKGND